MKRLLLLAMILLLPGAPSIAQEATETPSAGWTVVQHCVGKPTPPPKGWTFEGTILMTGYAGIHAVQADRDTPRVVAKVGDKATYWGGALSPNGFWYAVPWGDRYTEDTLNTVTEVNEIRIYSTIGDNKVFKISWPYTYFAQGNYGQIYWYDNAHLVYNYGNEGKVLLNPFTGEHTRWKIPEDVNDYLGESTYFRFAPDGTRAIYFHSIQFPPESGWSLYNLPDSTVLKDLPPRIHSAVWKPDSSGFIFEVYDQQPQKSPSGRLIFMGKDGNTEDVLFNSPDGQKISSNNITWSGDGRLLTFITFDYASPYTLEPDYGVEKRLYLSDTETHQIIDTCLAIGVGLAWSPDSKQLAFLAPGRGREFVMILDTETWKLHPVAYHLVGWDEGVIGWRAGD